ncbi:hypothetical protein DDB_G0267660 [Dictyostelium discoideum AX4]|uniref:Uncharacterized protein n=1 Tax=Dictyostelium discoideum TaxID=44689 RepID=Q55GI2_DICDI|nr:hypothetical protein DDB_G0267660 [Dictyostelium discoideum AX4]EAL73283.1 hypothetical protein DDB_G0267660 [Dictyostelium discoideum AX4]|eukprot:XP_647202.1 hypothetical protein DDB_G0267660 [Dictyostelium discoideum AX4]
MKIQKIEKLIKKSTIKTNCSFLCTLNIINYSSIGNYKNNNNNNIFNINNRYYSSSSGGKSNDIEQLILNDNLKNSNRNLYSIESIIEKFPKKDDFQNYLNQTKPIGKQLYDFMILSRYSYDNDINKNEYHNIFTKYIEELDNNNNNNNDSDNEVTLDFILEFNSKSYRKFDKLFSILFSDNNNLKITNNQFSLFFDSIIKVQNKIQNDNTISMTREQESRIENLIIEIVDSYLNLLKFNDENNQVILNINHYNKILEIYYNCNGKNINKSKLIKDTLDSIYLSHIKPDTETYMIAFPYISDTDSKLLLSKIKGDSNYKSGPNTYQLLSSQFDKLIK